jgi:hypothetical protein
MQKSERSKALHATRYTPQANSLVSKAPIPHFSFCIFHFSLSAILNSFQEQEADDR